MKPAKSESVCKQASVERVGRNEFSCRWGLAPESAGAQSSTITVAVWVYDFERRGEKGRGIKQIPKSGPFSNLKCILAQNDSWSQDGTMLSLLGEGYCAQYAEGFHQSESRARRRARTIDGLVSPGRGS